MIKQLLLLAVLLTSLSVNASQPVTLVVGYTPGSITDRLARTVQKNLVEDGIPVTIEYKTGAGGDLAVRHVATSKGKETVLALTSTNLVVYNIIPNANYNVDTDLVPLVYLGQIPMVLVASPKSELKSINDIKKLPDSANLRYGSAGIGSTSHVLGQMMSKGLNKPMTHVPYRGGSQVLPDLLSGEIELTYSFVSVIKPQIDAGKLIPLAITGHARNSEVPNVPTFNELGLDRAWVNNWYAIIANTTADKEILVKIQTSLQRLATDTVRSKEFTKDTSLVLEPKELLQARRMIDNEMQQYRRLSKDISFGN